MADSPKTSGKPQFGMTRKPKATFGDVMAGTPSGTSRDERPRRDKPRRDAPRTASGVSAPILDTPAPPLASQEAVPIENESFAELFAAQDKRSTTPAVKPGAKIRGTVFHLGKEMAFVTLPGAQEAMISLAEFLGADGAAPTLALGDSIEAFVVRADAEGILLSKGFGRGVHGRAMLEDARASGLPVDGKVTGVNPGGLEVEVGGQRAFCPVSQIALGFVEDPSIFVGKKLAFRVTELRGRDVVLSRKALLEAERSERAVETKKKLAVGAVFSATVTSVRPFGAFVDLGGVEGLIPKSELGYQRGLDPAEVVKVGETVQAEVIRIEAGDPTSSDKSKRHDRIALSLRALAEDPWDVAMRTLADGQRLEGKVVRTAAFGLFVEVASNMDGLLHRSQLGSLSPKVGETIAVRIEGIDVEARRISLALDGVPETRETPRETSAAPAQLATKPAARPMPRIGDAVDAVVERVESYGVFVVFDGGQGLVPSSETGTPQGADLRKHFPKGAKLRAVIVEIDDRRRLRLSVTEVARREERDEADAYLAKNRPSVTAGKHGMGTFADLFKKR